MEHRNPHEDGERAKSIGLFVTCLADLMRPAVARASLRLLEEAHGAVHVPRTQTCCGQPGYNSGEYTASAAIARRNIELFEQFDYTVAPSGSCAGMLKHHYPRLLTGEWRDRAERFAERVWELSAFLAEVCDFHPSAQAEATVAYHDSCAGLRELGVREQPRALLARAGVELRELKERDVCCGFGGTFCAKMPVISAKMTDDKLRDLEATGCTTLVAGDLGCLLALAGRAHREDRHLQFRHVAEVLSPEPGLAPLGPRED